MTWSRFDDGYDEHEKIEEAWHAFPPNPIGLHVQATTACNRWLSDGVIRPRWLERMLPKPADRKRILSYMVAHGLFDVLPAGETRVVKDQSGVEVPLGPHPEDRYVVHDFLDRHDSAEATKERRAKDAARKAAGRKGNRGGPSASGPEGVRPDVQADTAGTAGGSPPHARERAAAPASRPDPTRPDQAPPNPPPSAGGESIPKNSRAHGTNQRALALVDAAATITEPTVEHDAAWQALRTALAKAFGDDSVAWNLHIARLGLEGIDRDGRLVLGGRQFNRGRYERPVVAVGEQLGVPVRIATAEEAAGLAQRQSGEGVAA